MTNCWVCDRILQQHPWVECDSLHQIIKDWTSFWQSAAGRARKFEKKGKAKLIASQIHAIKQPSK